MTRPHWSNFTRLAAIGEEQKEQSHGPQATLSRAERDYPFHSDIFMKYITQDAM
jgi:hypothetical protein